jgi:xylulokinase
MGNLLGIDIGTSGVKVLLISIEGKIISGHTVSYSYFSEHPGWAEQDPHDWWNATLEAIRKIFSENSTDGKNIIGISLSGQMNSPVFLDKNLKVIRPSILWNDARTSKQCEDIYNQVGGIDILVTHTYNSALNSFTAPKILWVKENEPENYKKIYTILLPKDYIRYKLTNEIFTEASDAAGTLLFDVVQKKWSSYILDKLKIDKKILPPVLNSFDIAGKTIKVVTEKTGLASNIPVVAGAPDNTCGAVGSGIIEEGKIMASIGTSGIIVAQTDKPLSDPKGRITLFNHAYPDSWYILGASLSAGMSYEWLKTKLFNNNINFSRLDLLAENILPGSSGLIFLPYLYGDRTPHTDANARGVFFGISTKHDQAHFARSVMEGVAFSLKDSLELVKEKGIKVQEIRFIGGGAKSRLWQQILADIFNEEVNLINIEEGPAFGAALIAGVGVGAYKNLPEAVNSIIKIREKIIPDKKNAQIYSEYYQLYKNLYFSLKDDFKELGRINS